MIPNYSFLNIAAKKDQLQMRVENKIGVYNIVMYINMKLLVQLCLNCFVKNPRMNDVEGRI